MSDELRRQSVEDAQGELQAMRVTWRKVQWRKCEVYIYRVGSPGVP